jgi:hypothetical protein
MVAMVFAVDPTFVVSCALDFARAACFELSPTVYADNGAALTDYN